MSLSLPILAAADRPDILSTRKHLARLEEHYAVLELQRARAEGRCNRVAQHPDGLNEAELLRAELFANRIESQIHRALKELRKTELDLKKALAAESELPTTTASPTVSHMDQNLSEIAVDANVASSNESATRSIVKIEQIVHDHPLPESSSYTPDEFRIITARHRLRILSTPAENRPAFIARLIEEHRAKNAQNIHPQATDLPKPSQNGKHAA